MRERASRVAALVIQVPDKSEHQMEIIQVVEFRCRGLALARLRTSWVSTADRSRLENHWMGLPESIQADAEIRVVLAKEHLYGLDCPRAEVL